MSPCSGELHKSNTIQFALHMHQCPLFDKRLLLGVFVNRESTVYR